MGPWATAGYVTVVAAIKQDDLAEDHPVTGWPNASTVELGRSTTSPRATS